MYNDQRGGGPSIQPKVNDLGLPASWTPLFLTAAGFPAQADYNSNLFSFTAGAYVNAGTGEIVIAYKGTDLLLAFEGRSFNTAGDIVTNVGAFVGNELAISQFALL